MKKQFNKIMLVFTLCFSILPVSVYASESKEVEKDFTIEVSNEEVTKNDSFTVDVVEDKKDSNKPSATEKQNSEETIVNGNNRITKDEMKELLDSYSKSLNNGSSGFATPQSRARGTLIENVGADNKDYPIRRDIGSKSTTKTDNKGNTMASKERPSSDARQFLTFTTKSGKVFHLIIDHDKSSENVQLLTEVSELDLLNMIETKEVKEVPQQEVKKEEPKEEVKKEPKKQSGVGSYLILGLVLVGALGAGSYFKIVKPKQEEDFDYEEDENDDEFFVEESTEELNEEKDDEQKDSSNDAK